MEGLPDAVLRILTKGSQKDPAERYQSAAQMLAELDVVLATPQASLTFDAKSSSIAKGNPERKHAKTNWKSLMKGQGVMGKLMWGTLLAVVGIGLLVGNHFRTAHRTVEALAAAAGKPPAPNSRDQYRAEQTIHNLFKTDYADHTPAGKRALAGKLLDQGSATEGDPAARFVCFRDARDLSASAGDLALSLKAIDALDKEFTVDAVDMRAGAFVTAAPLLSADESAAAGATGLAIVDQAVAADDYTAANRLLNTLDGVAARSKQLPLVTRVQSRRTEVVQLQRESNNLRQARETLARDPSDPAANLALGRHQAFGKGDWSGGLPLLARGADSGIKALAAKELAKPSDASAQLQIADGWWDMAEQQAEPARGEIRRHAQGWYEQAWPRLSAPQRTIEQKRLSPELIASLNSGGMGSAAKTPSLPLERAPAIQPAPAGKQFVLLKSFPNQEDAVNVVQLSDQGRRLLMGAQLQGETRHRVVDVSNGKILLDSRGGGVSLAHDGHTLLMSNRLWDLDAGGKVYENLAPAPGYPFTIATQFCPDSAHFIFLRCGINGAPDVKIEHLFYADTKTGRVNKQMGEWSDDAPASAAVSPDGQHAAVGPRRYRNFTVELWDLPMAHKLWETKIDAPVRRIRFSGDGRRIYTVPAKDKQTVFVLDATDGHLLAKVDIGASADNVEISHDGQLLVSTGGQTGAELKLWDVKTGQPVSRLPAGLPACNAAVFTPDGARILAGFADNSVRLIDITKGVELARAKEHTAPVTSVAISPDGHFAATGGEDKKACVWFIPPASAN
jgi:WD40 repeat protein